MNDIWTKGSTLQCNSLFWQEETNIYRLLKSGIGGGRCSCKNHGMLQISDGHSFWHNDILLIFIGFFQRHDTIEFRYTST